VRIEVGPNEVDEGSVTLVHRPDGESAGEDRDGIVDAVEEHLETVYAKLYAAAEENLSGNVREASDRAELLGTIGRHGGYVQAPWCGDEACEAEVKEQIAAEIVLVPFEEGEDPRSSGGDTEPIHEGETCALCDDDAVGTAYFAKSY
jgi:prolyl-tRNA synthetase